MDMIPVSGKLPTTKQLKSTLAKYRAAAPTLGSGEQFLRLTRGGLWVFGADSVPAGDGRWIVHPMSFQHGYISWSDDDGPARVLGEIMVPFTEGVPPKIELEETGQPWADQVGFHIAGIEEKATLVYKTTSLGGKRAHQGIIDAILARMDEDSVKIAPIVRLKSESYRHKKWGEIFTPIFEIVGWADPKDAEAPEEKKPARRKRRAA